MDFEIFVTRGLGDNSYLVKAGQDGFIVDPQRDAWRFLEVAHKQDINISHVFETHVHNDYISGALEIRRKTSAEIVVPKSGNYEFNHLGIENGQSIDLGIYKVEAMASPGHTYEHTSWMVKDDTDKILAVFSGGSLIVGSAGRTDLLGNDHTEKLTKHQFETLQKYKELNDEVQILPTHGSGSFCTSANASSVKISSIGDEKSSNFAFQADNYDSFRTRVLNGLKQYPSYYKFMAPINRKGPEVLEHLDLPPKMEKDLFLENYSSGAHIIDARDRSNFAKKHLQNSINIELVPSFCSYVGWLIPFNDPIILIVDDPEKDNLMDAVTQLFRIGYTKILGYLPNSTNFDSLGLKTNSYEILSVKDLCEIKRSNKLPYLLDVRQPIEFETEGKLEESHNLFVTDIQNQLDELGTTLAENEVAVYCVSGQRASIASSLLSQRGIKVKQIGDGGINELLNC